MCYDVIACPTCGEWLDEFSASTHECKLVKKEEIVEKPIQLVTAKRTRR